MPSQLQIPTVTPEDLFAFHARIFGSPAPRQPLQAEEELHNGAASGEIIQWEDDDLGYYPDGAKRTLTDDQIAMFRHSEIYSILRERQVRKENLEAEGGEESETTVPQPEENIKATGLSDEGEVLSDAEIEEVSTTIPKIASQDMEVGPAAKKRKREDTDTGYEYGRKYASRSARGFVRELDSATTEEQILDYGDEPSAAEGSKQDGSAVTKMAEQDRESQTRPAEGKKIWWPVIEPT